MDKSYLMGLDFGSGSLKITLISTTGEIIGLESEEYLTYTPKLSWAEQNPEDWWNAFKHAYKRMKLKLNFNPKDILAIAPDAATHTAILMDKNFNFLRKAILWTDQRSYEQVNLLKKKFGKITLSISLNTLSPAWTLPQLLWIKENQTDIWEKTEKILFVKDYIRYKLCGGYITDWIDAAGSMLFDVQKNKWSEDLCEILGFPIDKLPEVVSPTCVVGKVSKKASQETDLPENIPVITGTTDTALEVFGAGAIKEGQATVKLATAGRICIVTEKPYPNKFLFNYRHVIPEKWYPGTATNSCASSFRWFKNVLGKYKNNGISVYNELDKNASEIPVGSEGLFFHPYLLGELTPYNDPQLKGSFIGVSIKHTNAHFTRAVLEGVAYSLKDSIGVLDNLGLSIKDAYIIGGGAKSLLWRQIVADVLGIEIKKPLVDDSSFGSALLAGVSIGIYSSFEEAVNKCVKIEKRVKPNLANHDKYNKYFNIYKDIHDQLKSTYGKHFKLFKN
jgi:xylulokinase